MNNLERGMVVTVDLNPVRGSETGKVRPCVIVTNNVYNKRVPVVQVVPLTGWTAKKAKIQTNIIIHPNPENGLTKKTVADCLQTRPVDKRFRINNILGKLDTKNLQQIDTALKIVFELN